MTPYCVHPTLPVDQLNIWKQLTVIIMITLYITNCIKISFAPTILSSILPVGKTKKRIIQKDRKKEKIRGNKWRTREVGVGESATLRRNIMRYLSTHHRRMCVNIVLNNRISIVTGADTHTHTYTEYMRTFVGNLPFFFHLFFFPSL